MDPMWNIFTNLLLNQIPKYLMEVVEECEALELSNCGLQANKIASILWLILNSPCLIPFSFIDISL